MTDAGYPVVVRPLAAEDGGGFMAYVPDLPGCMGDGATRDAALADVQSAIMEWMDEAARLSRPIPYPGEVSGPIAETVSHGPSPSRQAG